MVRRTTKDAQPQRRSSFKSPELWFGVVLGGIIGRTLNDVPSNWWYFGLIALPALALGVWLKDRLTERLYDKRDRQKADADTKGRRAGIHAWWEFIDFIAGTIVLFPFSVMSLLAYRWLI